MQSDQQKNYWEQNSGQSDDENRMEMYAPRTENDEIDQDSSVNEVDYESDEAPVYWQASEYISGEKNGLWFVGFGIVVVGLILIDLLFIKSYTFSALIVVMAIAVVVFYLRPPRMINYTLSGDHGLYIGEKLYHFSEFRAFGLLSDHNQHSLMLIPVKRFSPGVSVYFPEEAGERIVDIFGARLPMQDLKLDIIDVVVQKLRL